MPHAHSSPDVTGRTFIHVFGHDRGELFFRRGGPAAVVSATCPGAGQTMIRATRARETAPDGRLRRGTCKALDTEGVA